MDGAALGRVVVKRYVESYKAREEQWPVTMCAIHSAGIEPFAKTLDAFTMALRRRSRTTSGRDAAAARAHAQRAASTATWSTCGRCASRSAHSRSTRGQDRGEEGARRAQARRGLRRRQRQPRRKVEHCGGVTAYLPAPTDDISPYYKDLRFAQRHGWDEFLRSYRRAVRGT